MSPVRIVLLALAVAAGCSESEESVPAGTPTPSASTPAPTRSAVAVGSDHGQAWSTLAPKDDGYRLQGGSLDGAKVSVGDDRVKLKTDAGTLAKVKLKDYGFKVYRDDEHESAKVKRKGAGFQLSSPEGARWGELTTSGGTLSGEAVTIETGAGTHSIKRGGTVVGTVQAAIEPRAAVFLAVTELPMEQRVAAMVFVQEKVR
ncbi:MAG: hypothetical protein KC501_32235 [Myxococcales bacterium]|nr:hypothetical protein [Myxococcales bacterium]